MKKFRLLLVLLAVALVGMLVTSCDPDSMDSFIDGFYDGYYGTYGEATASTPIVE